MKKVIVVVIIILVLAAMGVIIFVLPLGTCQLGSGNPFNKNYQLVQNEPKTPGSVMVTTAQCSLFQAFQHEVIVVRM